MVITHNFSYYQPRQEAEILELLDKFQDKAVLLAGGTDLIVMLKDDTVQPEAIIDIKHVPGIDAVIFKGNSFFLGAGVTFSNILENGQIKENAPLLRQAAQKMASVGIRNRATVAGNICSAVPCMDSAPVLLCYEGIVHTVSTKGPRKIPVSEWFLGPRKTVRQPDEFVRGISIQIPDIPHGVSYLKLGRYRGEDLAQANLAVLVTEQKEYRVAFGSVGPYPSRAGSIEKLLNGQDITPDMLESAGKKVPEEIQPITDIRASRRYREHMCQVMLQRGLQAAVLHMKGQKTDSSQLLGG